MRASNPPFSLFASSHRGSEGNSSTRLLSEDYRSIFDYLCALSKYPARILVVMALFDVFLPPLPPDGSKIDLGLGFVVRTRRIFLNGESDVRIIIIITDNNRSEEEIYSREYSLVYESRKERRDGQRDNLLGNVVTCLARFISGKRREKEKRLNAAQVDPTVNS